MQQWATDPRLFEAEMTNTFRIAALAVLLLTGSMPASANPVERACLQSDRDAASRSLCRCIGSAAEQTLSYAEMRTGARFFTDPQRSVDVQLSDSRRNEAFWSSWRRFSDTASRMCG